MADYKPDSSNSTEKLLNRMTNARKMRPPSIEEIKKSAPKLQQRDIVKEELAKIPNRLRVIAFGPNSAFAELWRYRVHLLVAASTLTVLQTSLQIYLHYKYSTSPNWATALSSFWQPARQWLDYHRREGKVPFLVTFWKALQNTRGYPGLLISQPYKDWQLRSPFWMFWIDLDNMAASLDDRWYYDYQMRIMLRLGALDWRYRLFNQSEEPQTQSEQQSST